MNKAAFLLTLAGIIALVAHSAYAADTTAIETSLCSKSEITIFSCSLKNAGAGNFSEPAGVLSICSTGENPSSIAYYKWKKDKDSPEIIYPEKPISITKAFSFVSHSSGNLFDNYELISFSRNNLNFDVVIPADVGSKYQSEETFVGQEITLANNQLEIYECARKSIVTNMVPMKKVLRIPTDGRFSDFLQTVKVINAPFPITHEAKTDSGGFKTSVTYPVLTNAAINAKIKEFVNCYPTDDEYSHDSGSECSRGVSAKIIGGKFLVLRFERYNYAAGTPHGYSGSQTYIFLEHRGEWLNIKPLDLFIDSAYCKNRIGTMLYRQLRPIGFSSLMENDEGIFNGVQALLESAEISPAAKGIEFGYQQYQLGGYIPPAPVLIPWKSIESCLRQPVLKH